LGGICLVLFGGLFDAGCFVPGDCKALPIGGFVWNWITVFTAMTTEVNPLTALACKHDRLQHLRMF